MKPNKDLILLHGAIGAGDQFTALAKSLQGKGFKVHCLTFSGHGQQPFNTGFGIDFFSAELYQYIIAHNLQSPDIFGYSMGGYVALHLAAEKPNIIGRIATLATKFDWTPEGAIKEAAMLHPDTLQQKVPQFAAALQQRHGEQWIELLEKTTVMMKELGDKKLLDDELLKSLECPVMLGIGDKDTMVSLEETRAAFAQLPKATMYMLPNTKHPIEGVNVEMLSNILESFFKANT